MSDKKRSRSVNWEEKEKRLLIECVSKNKHIIESMETDTNIHFKKKEAWSDIQDIFEAQGFDREAPRLREQWFRMKAHAKKSIAAYCRDRMKHGNSSGLQPNAMDWAIVKLVQPDFEDLDSDLIPKKKLKLANYSNNDSSTNGDSESRMNSVSPELNLEHNTPLKVILTEGRDPLYYFDNKSEDIFDDANHQINGQSPPHVSTMPQPHSAPSQNTSKSSEKLSDRLFHAHIDKIEQRRMFDEEMHTIQKYREDEEFQIRKAREAEEYEIRKARESEMHEIRKRREQEQYEIRRRQDEERHHVVLDSIKEIRRKYLTLLEQTMAIDKKSK